jgi:NADH-quinone oxidoreductase subunit D
MILETNGDVEARFVVRIRELFESYRLVQEIIKNLPEGGLHTQIPRRIKPNETVIRVEAPRGELFYFLKSNGTDRPERIKVRTPTICNMTSVIKLAVGHQLADVPMILVGIDPCFSCNDRSVLISRSNNDHELYTWEQFSRYANGHYHGIDK